tara:strand:- start:296 stop:565 length:270 start_codon:yes stop_codon:yes gene_type:complete
MSNTLTDTDIKRLVKLGGDIQQDLGCDANGTGLPCRTDRFSAVENMIEYLEIHGMKIIKDPKIWVYPSKSEEAEGKKPKISNISEMEGA